MPRTRKELPASLPPWTTTSLLLAFPGEGKESDRNQKNYLALTLSAEKNDKERRQNKLSNMRQKKCVWSHPHLRGRQALQEALQQPPLSQPVRSGWKQVTSAVHCSGDSFVEMYCNWCQKDWKLKRVTASPKTGKLSRPAILISITFSIFSDFVTTGVLCWLLYRDISCFLVDNISFKYVQYLWICLIYISSDLKRVLSYTITNTASRLLALGAYDHCCVYWNAKERCLQLASMWHEGVDAEA